MHYDYLPLSSDPPEIFFFSESGASVKDKIHINTKTMLISYVEKIYEPYTTYVI